MTGYEIALIITAVGSSTAAFVTSVGGVLISLRNGRKLEAVHKATNGKMDDLLAVTASAARAEGRAEVLKELSGEHKPIERI